MNTTSLGDVSILIPSHIDELGSQAVENLLQNGISQSNIFLFAGYNYPSFSKLINDCVLFAKTETVIICNQKARPTMEQINKTLTKINEGFGFVGLHNFRFFGFKKDLIRIVGWFDERFVGGGYEDFDFLRRIKEHDIGVYMSREVPCVHLTPTWPDAACKEFNFKKWQEHGTHTTRIMQDELHLQYNIGLYQGTNFRPYKESVFPGDVPREFL